MTPFFENTERGVEIPSLKLEEFLAESKIYKYAPSSSSFIYVQVDGKKVKILKRDDIIGSLFSFIENFEFKDLLNKKAVHEQLSKSIARIKANLSNWIKPIELDFIKDTATQSYVFFNNCIVKITAGEISTHEYDKIEGHVWKEHIIDRDFTLDQPDVIGDIRGHFHQFLWYISTSNGLDNFNSLLTIIGYILHRYKDPTRSKCIIFYDSNVNQDRANGRTGKSLLCIAFAFIRKVIQENGKLVDPTTKFAFNRVDLDTNAIVFDDVPKSLRFEKFFPIITGDFCKEEKFENRIIIPYATSPKIILTSNYLVQGEGRSHEDRRCEFFIADFFSPDNTPLDFFEERFFEDWDDAEFNKFFNIMVMAIKFYLENGLIEPDLGRYYYDLKNSSPVNFVEKCDAYLGPGEQYNKAELFDEFREEIPGLRNIQQHTFTTLLKKYAAYRKWTVEESHSGDVNYILFSESE